MIVPQPVYYPMYEDKEKFIILVTGGNPVARSHYVRLVRQANQGYFRR